MTMLDIITEIDAISAQLNMESAYFRCSDADNVSHDEMQKILYGHAVALDRISQALQTIEIKGGNADF